MTLNHNYGCFSGVGSGIAGNYWYTNPRMNLTDLLVNYANEVLKDKQ